MTDAVAHSPCVLPPPPFSQWTDDFDHAVEECSRGWPCRNDMCEYSCIEPTFRTVRAHPLLQMLLSQSCVVSRSHRILICCDVQVSGTDVRLCGATGEWTGSDLVCRPTASCDNRPSTEETRVRSGTTCTSVDEDGEPPLAVKCTLTTHLMRRHASRHALAALPGYVVTGHGIAAIRAGRRSQRSQVTLSVTL